MSSALADLRSAIGRPAAMAVIAIAVLAVPAAPSLSRAGALNYSPLSTPLVAVDWQPPESLPPRFRNHCSYDVNRGRWYCSNHCGPDYQFYFCSPASFGCCHPGYGYCDWRGRLRCAP
jgi:hypothetical protein